MSIKVIIENHIQQNGFIEIDEFMRLVLSSKENSYYRSKKAIGEDADFITAPEISQMFGEMIGIWAIDVWNKLGKPKNINLVELGAGRGRLLRDLLKISIIEPGFFESLNLYILDINSSLIEIQKDTLKDYRNIEWIEDIEQISDRPTILLANEFFDALPIKQFVKRGLNWHEKVIISRDGKLEFGIKNEVITIDHPNAKDGGIVEYSSVSQDIMTQIASLIEKNKGAALIIDYGYDITPDNRSLDQYQDTLQAIKNHKFISIFDELGNADLTSHVDLNSLKDTAKKFNLQIFGAVTQQTLLLNLGIDIRLQNLQMMNPENADLLARQYNRLVADNQMGTLFKAIIVSKT